MIIVDYSTKKVLQGKLWQYNYGQVLRIQGGNLQKAQEIQFALEETGGDSLTRIGITQGGVTDVVIPDTMLENNDSEVDYPVYVFIYNRDETSGETVDKFVLNVLSRSKPEHTGGSDDGDAFGKVIEAVNNAAERAETAEQQAAKHAEQTKLDAIKTGEDRTAIAEMVESVSGIEQQVETVKEYKEQAQTAATNALLSEQKSNEAKEAALQAQARAESAANEAGQHATEAAGDKAEVERLATQVRQDKTAVEQTVQGFENTVQQAEQSINTAKTQAVETVNATKSNAIKAVQTEGTKQVEAVQAKGQEVINSIPSDFTTQMATKLDKQQSVEHAGKALVVGKDGNVVPGEPTQQIEVDKTLTQEGQAADAKATGDKILQYAIKVTASGESIVLTDSAEEKLLDFTMQGKTEQTTTTGKNLFDVSKSQPGYYQGAQGNLIEYDENFSVSDFIQISDAQNKLCISPLSESTASFVVIFNENKEKIYSDNNSSIASRKGVIDIPTGAKYIRFSSRGIENVQAEYSDTPTDYEPYTGGKPSPSVEYPQEIVNAGKYDEVSGKYMIDVKITGKNLLNPESKADVSGLYKGWFIDTKDDFITASIIDKGNGVDIGSAYFGTSGNGINTHNGIAWLVQGGKVNRDKKITAPHKYFTIFNTTMKTITDRFYVQVEAGKEMTEYEPFKLQTLTIPLDRPLTKWDKIEKRDGVWGVVHKSKEVVFNGSEDEVWRNQTDSSGNTQFYTDLKDCPIKHVSDFVDNFYCDKFTKSSKASGDIAIGEVRYGSFGAAFAPVFKPKHEVGTLLLWRDLLKENPITILYETNSEEFVPLPQETQTALNALHTYYPTTVMSNSEDCEMEVTYVCDTKNYIDNKISENVASVISQYQTNVVNLLSLMPLSVQAGMVENDTNNILENVEEMKHE